MILLRYWQTNKQLFDRQSDTDWLRCRLYRGGDYNQQLGLADFPIVRYYTVYMMYILFSFLT